MKIFSLSSDAYVLLTKPFDYGKMYQFEKKNVEIILSGISKSASYRECIPF